MGTQCKDPLVGYLKTIGYNAVRHPRAGLAPMEFLSRGDKDLDGLGNAEEVFTIPSGVELPRISADIAAAYLSGQVSGKLGANLGVTLLASIIGALGGGTLGLRAGFEKVTDVIFSFPEVTVDSVAPAAVSKFLSHAQVRPSSRAIGAMLEADDVFVVTDVAKARTFVVEAVDGSSGSVGLDVPAIQGVVGAQVAVTGEGKRSSKLGFTGNIPLVFAFQAIQLFYSNGRFEAFKPVASGTTARRSVLKRRPSSGARGTAPAPHPGSLKLDRTLVDVRTP